MSVRFIRFWRLFFCESRWLRLWRFIASLPEPVLRTRFFAPLCDLILPIRKFRERGRSIRDWFKNAKENWTRILALVRTGLFSLMFAGWANDRNKLVPCGFYVLLNFRNVFERQNESLQFLNGVVLIG